MLNISKTLENEKAVCVLEGRLDTVTAPQLEADLKDILPEIKELEMNFDKLEYISSAGLRVLLSAHKMMSKKAGMKLTHVHDSIMEIFEVTGFSDILNIEA